VSDEALTILLPELMKKDENKGGMDVFKLSLYEIPWSFFYLREILYFVKQFFSEVFWNYF